MFPDHHQHAVAQGVTRDDEEDGDHAGAIEDDANKRLSAPGGKVGVEGVGDENAAGCIASQGVEIRCRADLAMSEAAGLCEARQCGDQSCLEVVSPRYIFLRC